MRNKNSTKQNQMASIKALLMAFTVAAAIFACSFYTAAAIIAAMLTTK